MKNIVAIIGSAGEHSSNHTLITFLENITKDVFNIIVFDRLKTLPHFDPKLSDENTPEEIKNLRTLIEQADGIIISTPEYIFSIPAGLKNLLEWSVSTTIFSGKPLGIITASASGEKGHEELQLIMKTLMADFNPQTCLLIQGIKGKVSQQNQAVDENTRAEVVKFMEAYKQLVNQAGS